MMTAIRLYSIDSSVITSTSVEACAEEIDSLVPLRVSRTIGPANYFEIAKQRLAPDFERVSLPAEDISRKPFASAAGIGRLLRQNSVLRISFGKSQRIGAISDEIKVAIKGWYFWSDCILSFGPTDLTKGTVNEHGDEDVELVDVAHFVFSLSTDNFTGDTLELMHRVGDVPAFAELRQSFERIIGPLTLFLSR